MNSSSGKDQTITDCREFAISFINRYNREFANALKSGSFSDTFERFELEWGDFELPDVRFRLPNETRIITINESSDQQTVSDIRQFIRDSNFHRDNDAVIFFAPGNWAHVVEFCRMFPATRIMVVEPWPELLSSIIERSHFLHLLPLETVIVGMHKDLDEWEDIYQETIAQWKNLNLDISFFYHPQTWQIEEIKSMICQLP